MKGSKYVKIPRVNPLNLIIGEVDGSIKWSSTEEKNGNKYLVLASIDKNKELLEKYTELWNKINSLIEKRGNEPGEHGKDYMKIKFSSDDNLPLSCHILTIIVRSIFKENDKYYLQIFLDECLYEL